VIPEGDAVFLANQTNQVVPGTSEMFLPRLVEAGRVKLAFQLGAFLFWCEHADIKNSNDYQIALTRSNGFVFIGYDYLPKLPT
jgi:hypothetical protein